MRNEIQEKKCKKCGISISIASLDYCELCLKIIEVSKMSKKELIQEVIDLREEVESLNDERAGIDL